MVGKTENQEEKQRGGRKNRESEGKTERKNRESEVKTERWYEKQRGRRKNREVEVLFYDVSVLRLVHVTLWQVFCEAQDISVHFTIT